MSDGETKSRKARPYWLPVIIAFIMWLVLTYFYSAPEMVDKTRFTFDEWKNIGYLVTSIMLVWLFVWKITLNTEVVTEAEEDKAKTESKPKVKEKVDTEVEEEEEPPKEEQPKPRKKRVVVKAPVAAAAAADLDDELPDGLHRPRDEPEEDLMDLPRVIEWEKKDPGGVYSDTLIRVDDNLVLNLRTLLGKVCHNCEELDDCKRRISGKVDDDIFLFNFECKDGLKKELQKARKKREKVKAAAAKEMVEEKAATAKSDEDGEAPAKKTVQAKKKATPAKKKATPAKKKTTPAKKKTKVTKSTKKKSTSSSSSSKKTKAEEDK